MNYLTTALLHPRILPKLDFSDGIPDDCVTMVAVPTLLLNGSRYDDWWKSWKCATWAT